MEAKIECNLNMHLEAVLEQVWGYPLEVAYDGNWRLDDGYCQVSLAIGMVAIIKCAMQCT
jgi:hypothetical protein